MGKNSWIGDILGDNRGLRGGGVFGGKDENVDDGEQKEGGAVKCQLMEAFSYTFIPMKYANTSYRELRGAMN